MVAKVKNPEKWHNRLITLLKDTPSTALHISMEKIIPTRKMRLFIESNSIYIWEIIENRDYVPTMEQHVPQVTIDPD